jgi:uncharacterized membrane protein
MRRSSLTAILAILLIVGGAIVFGVAVIAERHFVTLIGLVGIGAGIILACQGDGAGEPAAH